MSNKNLTSDKGSIWRKWDLHLHTPFTKLSDNFKKIGEEDIWKSYCDKIESSDVAAFGITDYFSCENYFTFLDEFKKYYPDSKKVFFPNIEFRLDVAVNKKAEEINIHLIFSNELERTYIEDFLTVLKTNHTLNGSSRVSCKNLSQDQFKSATINHNDLQDRLKETFGNQRPYLILAAVNNAGLRPISNSPRKLAITDEIDKICDAFFGGRQNVNYCLNPDRYETDDIAKARPVICGCDAHSFDDLDSFLGKFVTRPNPSDPKNIEILKDVTWIKADLTFEGLKQIVFEPMHRVIISENEPRKPVRRVESIKFNFPISTFIKSKNFDSQQDFCLKNLRQPIYFSDYFTCIIGGRGTGKSTIINILAEKLNGKTKFFQRSNLIINNANYEVENDTENYIEITGTNEIEFVSQGKIEQLAEANELTKLIFEERIKEIESDFIQIESDYEEIFLKIDDNIDILNNLMKIDRDKKIKTKEKETIKKIIDSINDDRYRGITTSIKNLKKELNSIEKSKLNYKLLLDDLRKICQDYKSIERLNDIDIRIQEIISTVIGLDELQQGEEGVKIIQKEFNIVNKRIEDIKIELEKRTKELRGFFEEKGTNEETIKDSQKASETLSKVIYDLENIEKLRDRLKETYRENNLTIDNLESLYGRNRSLIASNLTTINNKLRVNDENVLDINFTYEFDDLGYEDSLFEEFCNKFSFYMIPGTSKARVRDVLFLIEPSKDLINVDFKTFQSKLHNTLEANNRKKQNNYVKVVTEIFNSHYNYLIYINLIKKHRFNLSKYIKINGFYGNRELESCSFGQRCTAVIVTLLMTGVKPLIIDEPEAHLDNKLVADYLVGLVKQKQFDRQIIFASHNSNFVINGDSALIHILEIPNNDVYTRNTSTTIENIEDREKLLKLEGGKEAFLNRESKYGI